MKSGSGWRIAAFVVAVVMSVLGNQAQAQCIGDLYEDGRVDGADLGALLAYWGPVTGTAPSIRADLNSDGAVDGNDLGVLLGKWGACPIVVPSWATLLEALPDPAVVTNPALRQAIVGTGLAWRVRHTATQIEMLLVPPGTFRMGCSASPQYPCDADEFPSHDVTLANPFYIGRYEVTQTQWTDAIASNPSRFQGLADSPNRPVEQVSFNAVQGFLAGTGLRLPTEAEWEYACRAGTDSAFNNGFDSDLLAFDLAWTPQNSSGQSYPVGLKLPNRLGLFDMHGNVFEWVSDFYDPGYYSVSPVLAPQGPASGPGRVIRGGSWKPGLAQVENVRSSNRWFEVPGAAWDNVGFRVARNP